jgi:hypothetical protein
VKLNPVHARRLASLSALAAGALVAGAGKAEATTVFGTLSPSSGQVGFDSPFGPTVQGFSTMGGAAFTFHTSNGFPARGITGTGSKLSVKFSAAGANFKTNGGLLALFSAGRKFSTVGGNAAANGTAAWRSWFKTRTFVPSLSVTLTVSHSAANPSPFTNEYSLFSFDCPAGTCYGWLDLSLVYNSAVQGTPPNAGPDLQLVAWAYDNAGAQTPAGSSGVPEPGTLGSTGLAALVLGAAGVRRWRAARPAKTA